MKLWPGGVAADADSLEVDTCTGSASGWALGINGRENALQPFLFEDCPIPADYLSKGHRPLMTRAQSILLIFRNKREQSLSVEERKVNLQSWLLVQKQNKICLGPIAWTNNFNWRLQRRRLLKNRSKKNKWKK